MSGDGMMPNAQNACYQSFRTYSPDWRDPFTKILYFPFSSNTRISRLYGLEYCATTRGIMYETQFMLNGK
ncbi:MAG: hypothetical protein NT149_02280 [Candidatus Gottesmanbacteria bacterium]|nr:hypothetical protein [Candidatus Gottesmanbacteria bacterium]